MGLLLSPDPAWAEGPQQGRDHAAAQASEPPRTLTVALDDNYPPYVFRDQQGRLQGILVDAWQLWQKRTGLRAALVAKDWAQAQVEIQMGRADVIDTIFETAARRELYAFGKPYATIQVPIYFHESIGALQGPKALQRFTVGVKDGDACHDFLVAQGQESFRRYPNYEAIVAGAALGEVRVFCMDKVPAAYLIARKQVDKQLRSSAPLFSGQLRRAVRKGNEATLKLVEEGFAQITPAEWRQIEEKWMGSPIEAAGWASPYWRYSVYVAGGVVLLAVALGGWNISLRRRVHARTVELMASLAELTQAKQQAEATAAKLNATLEAIPDLLFELDSEGRYVDYRAARTDLLAAPPERLIGRKVREVMPPEQAERVMAALREAADHGVAAGALIKLDLPHGEHWFEMSVARKREGRGALDHFIVLSRDITDRKRAEHTLALHGEQLEEQVAERSRELVLARDAAERASRAKSEFLSRMSHELRTPMNAILGFSQLLQMDASTAPKARQFVDEILRAGQHLLHLINDVLDLEQVESGRLTLSPEPIRLRDLCTDAIGLMQPLADKQHITLHLGRMNGLVVRADMVRVKQIVLNLLSNAVKYNRLHGVVWLEAEAVSAQAVRITVRDNGLGIAAHLMPHLFQPFSRLGAEAGGIEGTGIGLSLCRRVAEVMGGRVGAGSCEGVGSSFWVELPRAADEPEPALPDVLANARPGEVLDEPELVPRHSVVLYVEDNPANLQLMTRIVERHPGITLISSPQGQLGLELARAHRPDLIMLDIHLPDIDGYALLAQLRQSPATRHIPVVAVTANAMPGDVSRIRAAGFDDYLPKPIQVTRIDALLHEKLGTTVD